MSVEVKKQREAFPRNDAAEYTRALQASFIKNFQEFGSMPEQGVKITSGIDESVRFIGSHISVLKPYIKDVELPKKGVVISQDCVRTRNLTSLGNEDFLPKWGSYFQSLGALVPYDYLLETCNVTFEWFHKDLGCEQNDLVVRINREDEDLMSVCKELLGPKQLEVDTKEASYYRHSIGMDKVAGRNFNIAIRSSKDDTLNDIGNVIVLEKEGRPHSVEIAIGGSTTLKQLYGLSHVLDCHPVPSMFNFEKSKEGLSRQLEDIIVTSIALSREGLVPSNRDNRSRILKKYLGNIDPIIKMLDTKPEVVENMINVYEVLEYGNAKGSHIW